MTPLDELVCRIIGSAWQVNRAHELEALKHCRSLGVPGMTMIGALIRRADEVLAAAPTADIERRVQELDQQVRLGYQGERIALGFSEGRQAGNRFYGPRKVAASKRSVAERCRREIDAARKERERLEAELKGRAHAQARA